MPGKIPSHGVVRTRGGCSKRRVFQAIDTQNKKALQPWPQKKKETEIRHPEITMSGNMGRRKGNANGGGGKTEAKRLSRAQKERAEGVEEIQELADFLNDPEKGDGVMQKMMMEAVAYLEREIMEKQREIQHLRLMIRSYQGDSSVALRKRLDTFRPKKKVNPA
jgi:hypothetical protein